ncbi:ribonuclease Z [Wenyingzhuangia sp. IMCC45574]
MNTTSTEKYTLITAENNFDVFKETLSKSFTDFNGQHIVIDLSNIETLEEQVTSLAEFAEIQLENNLSFVIIVPSFDADAFDEELNVVPTLTEAEDMIDMDEMTRDLGF